MENKCQWCDSKNLYISGHSPMCVETEHTCKDCRETTWLDLRKKEKK